MSKLSVLKGLLAVASLLLLSGFYGCLDERVSKTPSIGTSARSLVDYVDTRAGTGGALWASGHTSPAASVPHGLIKLGPDTVSFGRILSTSGYSYSDTDLIGFSHTRYSGTGAWEGGSLRVMPLTYAPTFKQAANYLAHFSHDSEIATPGSYSVFLSNFKVRAELTATSHVGYHRYQFEPGTPAHLGIELTSHLSARGKVVVHEVSLSESRQQISGSLTVFDDFSKRYGGQPVFFVISLKQPVQSHRFLFENKVEIALSASIDAGSLFVHLAFGKVPVVELTVALSHVSLEGARSNLQTQIGLEEKSFDQVKESSKNQWEALLSRIHVETDEEKAKRIFYQSLYRSFLMPTIISDAKVLGTNEVEYRGFDKAIHRTDGFTYYGELSLWDTFRTVHPLYNLIAPDTQADVLHSLMAMGRQSGRIPRWAGAGGHTDSMIGFAGNIVISESFQKGIGRLDPEEAFSLVQQTMTPDSHAGKECLKEYIEFGYCPMDHSSDSVSLTLEYSYADYSMALMAEKLGKTEQAAIYRKRSQSYKNLWNPQHLAFVPKNSAGEFEKDFVLLDSSYVKASKAAEHYREGSPNQWRWYVPWDARGLLGLFGDNYFVELGSFFEKSPPITGTLYPGSYYWHGNEPDIHASFLFAAAGQPELTQKWTRWIMDTKYKDTSDALEGDDDCGTLSSWYVLSALGIFPIAGTDQYVLTTPRFTEARISLNRSRKLTVSAKSPSPGARYSCGATLNGEPLSEPKLSHAQIAEGGVLEFELSEVPCAWH